MRKTFLFSLVIAGIFCGFSCTPHKERKMDLPNIVVVYVDDLGYGDVGCYGALGVKTPNVDFLAANGMQFTDAHCTAATCTPSRYSLLTGSYAFRNNAAILPGDAPLLIRPGTPTLPGKLKDAGYTTAVIGKWHLGLGNGTPDWNSVLKPGPLEVGFDYSFIIPATLDRVPTVFVKNHKVYHRADKDSIFVSYTHKVGDLPIGLDHPEMLKVPADSQHSGTIVDSISRIGFMSGGQSAWWRDENISKTLAAQMTSFITDNKDKPFFLYYSLNDIHVPRAPNEQFVGKSTMGSRGDAIAEMDWQVGQVLQTLKKLNLQDNTLVVFTSDNGPVLDDGYGDSAVYLVGDHKPGGPFKGGKYSAYEAGTRVPTVVYWPGKVAAGISHALVSQVDLYAAFAALTGQELEGKEAPDSYNMLDAWLGKDKKGRKTLLEESYTMSLRDGKWKYIAPQTKPTPAWLKNKDIAVGLASFPQLYNLEQDGGETNNVMDQQQEQGTKMEKLLHQILDGDGSRF